jgi:hypothetical protein
MDAQQFINELRRAYHPLMARVLPFKNPDRRTAAPTRDDVRQFVLIKREVQRLLKNPILRKLDSGYYQLLHSHYIPSAATQVARAKTRYHAYLGLAKLVNFVDEVATRLPGLTTQTPGGKSVKRSVVRAAKARGIPVKAGTWPGIAREIGRVLRAWPTKEAIAKDGVSRKLTRIVKRIMGNLPDTPEDQRWHVNSKLDALTRYLDYHPQHRQAFYFDMRDSLLKEALVLAKRPSSYFKK